MTEIFRAFDAQVDSVLEGERAIVARINSAAVDRLKTVIDPMGGDTSHFNKTRSVLWNHGQDPIRGTVPIGRGWVKVRASEGDILGKTTFGKDKFTQELFECYKDESIRGWSIKAGVHEASPPTKEEIRSRPELDGCEMIYRKWDLIEYSATPTPGNSDCLTLLVSRGLITPPEGFVMPERTATESNGMATGGVLVVPRYITHSGDKWVVHAEDGKVLGEHDNEEDAKKQLAAVEAHKHDEGRSIQFDGATWNVVDAGRRLASFADVEDAEELVRAMDRQRSFEQILTNLHTEQQARFDEAQERIIGLIELKKFGRI